ncbi:MAG: ABC transporter substrate-binding protein [Anaerolineae bacterium]|nr:ABC transporter substrate-binding protein [Anaerolineae bacterium]
MNTRITRFILVVSLAALLLAGCAPAAPEKVQVRIGTQPWIGYGPWFIAVEKGYFDQYNLAVELINFNTDQDVNAAFASGNMEAANLATHTATKLYTAGVELRIALLEDASYEADAILAGSGIASIADLKGKKVAYEEGATSDLLLNYALAQNGMSIADIVPVPLPASDAGLVLAAGEVDAAVTYEPYITEVLKQDSSLSLLYTAAENPGLISDVLVVPLAFAQSNPQAVRDMLKVWDEALAFYKSNPDEAKAIIARNVGAEPADLATAFDGVEFYDLAANKEQLTGGFFQTFQDIGGAAVAMGYLESFPIPGDIFDASFLE